MARKMETIDLGFRVLMKGLKNGMSKAGKSIKNFAKGAGIDFKSTGSAAGNLGKLVKGGMNVAKKALKLVAVAATATAAAFTAMVVSSVKAFAEFELRIAEIKTLGVKGLDVTGLGEKALELMREMGFSTGELLKGFYDALSAGISTESLNHFMEQAGILAVAGVTSIAVAVDGLTSLANAYAIETEGGINAVANILNETKNLGKTTVAELSASIGRVAPTAAGLGVSMEELGAALATATAKGINTRESMSGLKALLQNLVSPGNDAAAMAKFLGIELGAVALKNKGLIGIMESVNKGMTKGAGKLGALGKAAVQSSQKLAQLKAAQLKAREEGKKFPEALRKQIPMLKKATADLFKQMELAGTPAEQAFVNLFGSVEALNMAFALTQDGAAVFQGNLNAITQEAITGENALAGYNEIQDTLAQQWKNLKGFVNALRIEIGKLTNEDLRSLIDTAKEWLETHGPDIQLWFDKALTWVKTMIEVFWPKIKKSLDKFWDMVQIFIEALGIAFSPTGIFVAIVDYFTVFLDILGWLIGQVGIFIKQVKSMINWVKNALKWIAKLPANILGGIGNFLLPGQPFNTPGWGFGQQAYNPTGNAGALTPRGSGDRTMYVNMSVGGIVDPNLIRKLFPALQREAFIRGLDWGGTK